MTSSGGSRLILGMRVDATDYPSAVRQILAWAEGRESRYVCVATVHMTMEAHDNRSFQDIVNAADLVTADGMPLVWALRMLGVGTATRVYGPELTPRLCEAAQAAEVPVGFYGGTEDVLLRLKECVARRWPRLPVAYAHSPPFRALTPQERASVMHDIHASGARILFVGLGCPKQERWMAAHRPELPAVMVGVGAAFDFLAGTKRQAPPFLQRAGLEWSFRLATEPRRLWWRYLYHNPRYVGLFAAQLMRGSLGRRTAPGGPTHK